MAVIRPDQLYKYLNNTLEKAEKASLKSWQTKAKPVIKEEILDYVSKGKSPVKNQGNFEKYSVNYKKKDKSVVNLKVTGKMLKSIKVKKTLNGISVFFSSPIMKYHNGQGRVDRLTLPVENNQEFRKEIKQKLASLYKKIFKI